MPASLPLVPPYPPRKKPAFQPAWKSTFPCGTPLAGPTRRECRVRARRWVSRTRSSWDLSHPGRLKEEAPWPVRCMSFHVSRKPIIRQHPVLRPWLTVLLLQFEYVNVLFCVTLVLCDDIICTCTIITG